MPSLTAALQTFASEVRDNEDSGHKPCQLDKCHALNSHSEAVRRVIARAGIAARKPGRSAGPQLATATSTKARKAHENS